jgi:hypothetical protein
VSSYPRDMLARRLLILLAVLMGLTALAAGVAPRRPLPSSDQPGTAQAAPSAGKSAKPLKRTIDANEPSSRKIVVQQGRLVDLTVQGDVVDSVQLGDLEVQPLDPDSPALFEVLADTPGTYPIELVNAQRRLGVLQVKG